MLLPTKYFNKMFPMEITKRIFILFIGLFILATIAYSYFDFKNYMALIKAEREREFYGVTVELDKWLPGSFEDILKEHNAQNKPVKEQVRIINSVLQPIVDSISSSHPDVGMGYYSIELDHIVAIGPVFNISLLETIPRSYPYFKSYETGMPEFDYHNTSIGWMGKPILNLTYPIYRNDKIIGHTWANVKMESIYVSVMEGMINQILVSLLALIIVSTLTWYLFESFRKELSNFANAVSQGSSKLPKGMFLELNPLLELIVKQTEQLKKVNEQMQIEIDNRQQAEIMLSESEERYRMIFENSADGIFMTHPDGAILAANPAACKMLGRTEEELCRIGRDGVVDKIDKRLYPKLKERELSGKAESELVLVKKDGCKIIGEVSSRIFKSKNGDVLSVVVVRDVTERNEIRKEMARLDRLNLVGQMAAGIGHEIRNPMTSIRGFLQLIQSKSECHMYSNYFELMIEELDRANAIITEFLSLAKNRNIEQQQLDLNSVLMAIMPLISADAMNSNKYIDTELAEIPNLLLNEKEIRQLILNLVRNGLEAMEHGCLKIRTYIEGNAVVLSVQDEGKGISADVLEKLGTPFFTTKEEGTGLGLATCHSIAARHNAVIDIDTEESGTTFKVRFRIYAPFLPQQSCLLTGE